MQRYISVMLCIMLFVLSPLFTLRVDAKSEAEERIIIIDAGHGGLTNTID